MALFQYTMFVWGRARQFLEMIVLMNENNFYNEPNQNTKKRNPMYYYIVVELV